MTRQQRRRLQREGCRIAACELALALAGVGFSDREIVERLCQLADVPLWPGPEQIAEMALTATEKAS